MQYININSIFVFGILAGSSVVNAPSGLVYAHFPVDVVAIPLFWTVNKSQAKYFDILRVIHVV